MIARFNGRENCARRALLWQRRLMICTSVLAVSPLAAIATDLATPIGATNSFSPAPLPEITSAAASLFRVLGALALVLAVFFGGVWLFRHWQRTVVAKGQTPKLHILETKSLGQRHAIYVIGYEQQRLLIAASPAGVTMLSPLPAATGTATDEAPATQNTFSAVLRQALQRKS